MHCVIFVIFGMLAMVSIVSAGDAFPWLRDRTSAKSISEILPSTRNDYMLALRYMMRQRYLQDSEGRAKTAGKLVQGKDAFFKRKSGWPTIGLPIQTRFVSFGSKLYPSTVGNDHGSTLLRYGRSV